MVVAQVVEIKLRGAAESMLSYRVYQRTQEWLKQWTCVNNIKAVIAPDREEALDMIREDLREKLIPSWLKSEGVEPCMFLFNIDEKEVENGRFWGANNMRLCVDFEIDEIPQEKIKELRL